MSTKIYYFTGTGNSLAAAKDISGKLGGELIPVASVAGERSISIDADIVGIVFPVYNHGIPFIIKTFAEKAADIRNKYMFAVCTYGNNPCLANEKLSALVNQKGGCLAGAFAVNMPYNYISPVFRLKGFLSSFTLSEITAEKQREMLRVCEKRLAYICDYVAERKTGIIETSSETIERLIDRLNLRETLQKSVWLRIAGYRGRTDLPYIESVKLMDHAFTAGEGCTGCATCERICPAGNISMAGGRPVWLHKCAQCFACLQWCPREAIQFGGNTSGRKRYHHPDITLPDMFSQSNYNDSEVTKRI
jgi:formate hydrogenlyase subunit 6/NADH:ubiquinone oxidoreductase subunit I/flavodoxin